MKKTISLIALIMTLAVLLSACGVPQEKIDQVTDLYAQAGDGYEALYLLLEENGLLEDYAQEVADYGEAIKNYGETVKSDLSSMDEDKIDNLISELNDLNDQITAIYDNFNVSNED